MLVYHLEVEAYSREYGELKEKHSNKTGVYSTLEKALEEGKEFLERRFKRIYEGSNYCTQDKDSLKLEDMLRDDEIYYLLQITEIDPEYADNYEMKNYEYECIGLQPTHKIYCYNYKAELEYTELEYQHQQSGSGHVIIRYPRG